VHGHALESRIVATYDYRDDRGELLHQVVRLSPKDFRQRRPDGAGGWIWSTQGVRRVLYRLVDLVEDDADRVVYVTEGEKDADALAARGYLATCNPGGAGKWRHVSEHAREVLRDRDVVIVADADDVGRRHALEVADSLRGVVRSLVTLECPPPHKDVSDLLAAGGQITDLVPLRPAREKTEAREAKSEPGSEEAGAHTDPWSGLALSIGEDHFRTAPPERKWLLRDSRADDRGWYPLGKVGQLISEGGVGKTMVLCQLALAVASVEPQGWLGTYSVAEPGRVLLVLGEEDAEEVHRRLYSARRALDAPIPPPGSIVVLPLAGVECALQQRDQRGEPMETAFGRWLLGYVREHGPFSLVVLDPLSRFAGLDAETDNACATRFIQRLEAIASLGPSVLFAHHNAKAFRGDGARQTSASGRGASAFYDGSRFVLAMSYASTKRADGTPAELVTLTCEKNNYAPKGDPVTLRRSDIGGALVPLSALEREEIEAAKVAESPTAKRRAEREAEREERERREAERRAAKQAERDAAAAARIAAEDSTILAILAATPGLPEDRLVTDMRARLGELSSARGRAAIARARLAGRVVTRRGPKNSTLHYLPAQAPPSGAEET
jgi:RecA-family ATPase